MKGTKPMIEFTKVEGKDIGDIRLFGLSTCVWCKKTKKYLEAHNIEFSYVYVDLLSEEDVQLCLEEQLKYNKEESYPLVAIGKSDCIVGYDKQKLDKLVEDK